MFIAYRPIIARFVAAFFCTIIVYSSGNAQTQEVPLPQIKPLESLKLDPPVKPLPTVEFPKDLDGLFVQLKRTRDQKLAERISTRIWELWQTSDSKSVDLLTNWARAAAGTQRFAKALDLLDQVVVLRPQYAEGYNQRATLHFMMENYGKSVADIERTLALEPRHYGALAGLASILERLDQKPKALETWYRALEIYPAMKSAQDAVIRLEEDLTGSGI